MSYRQHTFTITGNSPATATTAAVGDVVRGLDAFDWIAITATITGSTNGAVDCCLQFKNPDADEWWDWIRFAQVTATNTAKYQVQVGGGDSSAIVAVGSCTTASPAVTLAAGTSLGGRPTGTVRLVATGGAGTDSAAEQTVQFHCWRRPK